MTTASRAFDRGTRAGARSIQMIGREFEAARLGIGASQEHVAAASRISRSRYSKIENGRAPTLRVLELARIATVLGLDSSIRLYPGGPPVRDAGHARRLGAFVGHVERGLVANLEVPLPALPDRLERRAWDATIEGHSERTAIELELRLNDTQALERRISLKRRDDPPDHFLLLIADTRANRRILAELPNLFRDLRRIPTAQALDAVERGEHPGTGIVLI